MIPVFTLRKENNPYRLNIGTIGGHLHQMYFYLQIILSLISKEKQFNNSFGYLHRRH